ncbi:hypothetical protein BJ138DRAFT_1129771 [Hygrophoropsis aurantiaca]|uniref:Uncharacterized protein n=1 Tax=Hygrophoropsis aurantiaca TaxID=72124 RepID=A0ACB8A1Y2_9AGAM|nr:hypothetical protein BJ138DRAFT_1129771 [Hygrophoropsis aurantiaca]
MDASWIEAMDAQRFDPLRRIVSALSAVTRPRGSIVSHASPLQKSNTDLPALAATKITMGQALCMLSNSPAVSEPSSPSESADDRVGGLWDDHEMVVVPIAVRASASSMEASSFEEDSSSSSTSSPSSYHSYAESSPPSSIADDEPIASSCRQIDVYDRQDLIITRTIIRPAPVSPISGIFSRPSSPLPTSRPSNPIPLSPLFQSLNCFNNSSAFEEELDFLQDRQPARLMRKDSPRQRVHSKANPESARPALKIVVTQTQTRFDYEQDMAFKQDVQELLNRPHNIAGTPVVA